MDTHKKVAPQKNDAELFGQTLYFFLDSGIICLIVTVHNKWHNMLDGYNSHFVG